MVVERLSVLLHDQRLVDTGTVGVASDDTVSAVQFEQDVFVVVDVSRRCRATGNNFLLHPSSQPIILIVRRRCR